ncbi:hypothetical protein AAVH_22943 [Aphelenchoides avenae]|nr:hypothetical protein AAVH_22943 [Aphelenchus avenae]
MDWSAWVTTVVVGYATGFLTSQDFAIVDLTLNSDPPNALVYTNLTPYAVTQRIKRLRRIGSLPAWILVTLWLALLRPSFRRRWTRMTFQMASGVVSLAGLVLFVGSRCESPPRMYATDFGYILLGFGNSMSYSFGYALLRGDTRDVLHRERNQILSYQRYALYLGRLCGLLTSLAMSSDLCFLVDTVILASVTFATSSYLRDYSREDYPVLSGVPTSNVQREVAKSTYLSGAFIKGLLLASIPLALYEHFNEAWQWSAEKIYERVGLDKASLYSNALWDNVARAGFGGYIFSYTLFKRAHAETNGATKPSGYSQWKTRMLWVAIVSPSVLMSCLLYSRAGVDNLVNWFVLADTMFAIHWMSGGTSGTWYMMSHFPGDSALVGISLARVIREVWKLVAEPLVLASIDYFGWFFFFVTCLACRLVCSAVVYAAAPSPDDDDVVVDEDPTSNVDVVE